MLVYEAYHWFSRALTGRAERERQHACGVLLTLLVLVFLHSGQAASFRAAISQLAAAVLSQPVVTASVVDATAPRD